MSQIGTPLVGLFDLRLVVVSLLIAILASYGALDLAVRVTVAKGIIRRAWLAGGAISMGLGIWSMHFVGMLALNLPVSAGLPPADCIPAAPHSDSNLLRLTVCSHSEKMGLVQAVTGRSAPHTPSRGGRHEPNRG